MQRFANACKEKYLFPACVFLFFSLVFSYYLIFIQLMGFNNYFRICLSSAFPVSDQVADSHQNGKSVAHEQIGSKISP